MKYEELYDEFINLFPEDISFFKKLEEETGTERGMMYVLFGSVVVPFLRKIVEEEPEKAKTAFDFIERMEKDTNPEVGNVAEVSILEDLVTEEGGVDKYMGYFGEETMKAANHIARYFTAKTC